jgi:hypothetical protein
MQAHLGLLVLPLLDQKFPQADFSRRRALLLLLLLLELSLELMFEQLLLLELPLLRRLRLRLRLLLLQSLQGLLRCGHSDAIRQQRVLGSSSSSGTLQVQGHPCDATQSRSQSHCRLRPCKLCAPCTLCTDSMQWRVLTGGGGGWP